MKDTDIPVSGRPAVEVLTTIADGDHLKTMSAKLAEVTAAVHEHGGTGEVTVKIKVKNTGRNAVALSAKVTSKKPEGERLPTIMFSSDDGKLTLHDPDQMDFKDKDASFVGK